MLLKGLKIDDNALKLMFLEFHLEEDAIAKFENISNSPNPSETYEQTKQALLDAFPVMQDTLFHGQILRDCRQKAWVMTLSNFDLNGLKVAQKFSSVPLAPEPNETSNNRNEQVWALDDRATASVLPKVERIDPCGPTAPLINEGSACNQA
uniref:Uncharacterized protein n=1 Tax=Romanomermis culicivorax TaxID=13658 RepID=A0A915HF75_ROMCU